MANTETITISHFKATCLAVLEKVKRTGQPVLVTRHGKAVAMIDPPPSPPKQASWLGSFRDHGKIVGDIITPVVSEEDWDALRE